MLAPDVKLLNVTAHITSHHTLITYNNCWYGMAMTVCPCACDSTDTLLAVRELCRHGLDALICDTDSPVCVAVGEQANCDLPASLCVHVSAVSEKDGNARAQLL